MKDIITKYANEIGIDLIGFTDNKEMNEIKDRIESRIEDSYISKFDSFEIENKINPNLYLEDCESIIVVGVPYKFANKSILENSGRLSSIAIGEDYHKNIKEKLLKLVDFIKLEFNDINYKICIDTCDLADRQVAYKAGIGFYGKNNFIISNKYGSAINIGYILLNKKIKSINKLISDSCGKCQLCINSCPTNALSERILNVNKCISELTQLKRNLTYIERELVGHNIYGCDICQNVCPKNSEVKFDTVENSSIDLIELISLSNKEFKSKFSDRAFYWRGNSIIKRNAIIAIGNYNNPVFFDELKFLLKHQSDSIKKYALWALFKSDKKRFLDIDILNKKLLKEKDKIIKYYLK